MDEDKGLVSSKDTPRSSTLFAAHSQKSYENIDLCTKNIKQFKPKLSFLVYFFYIPRITHGEFFCIFRKDFL